MSTFGKPYPVDTKLYYYGRQPHNLDYYGPVTGGRKMKSMTNPPKRYKRPTARNYDQNFELGYHLGDVLSGGAKGSQKGALAALLSGLSARVDLDVK